MRATEMKCFFNVRVFFEYVYELSTNQSYAILSYSDALFLAEPFLRHILLEIWSYLKTRILAAIN